MYIKNLSKENFRTSRIAFLIASLFIVFIVLRINFTILPELEETLVKVSPTQIESIKNKIYLLTIGALVFIFLFNLYFWKIGDKLENEEKKTELALKIDPTDSLALEKLREVKRKRKFFLTVVEPIFIIILGAAVGLIVAIADSLR